MTMTTLECSTDTLYLPDAPAFTGLSFRRFRGEGDYPKMIAVIDGSKIADKIERTQSVEDITRLYAHLTNCDPYQDMLFVEMNGEVIGYNRVWWQKEALTGDWVYTLIGFLLPAWRGKGIGRAALHYLETRLREIAREHPQDGQARFFQTFAADTEAAREALLLSEGYAAIRHGFHMVRPLSKPITVAPMPPGLEVRTAQPEQFRAVWEADQEAFRDHWGYVPGTETDYQAWLNQPIFNPDLWQVAWDIETNQVAGMVQNFLNAAENAEYNRQRGYTEGISVRRPWRRRGLARALLTRSLQMFKDMGMTEAALGVDTENLSGALRLYESVGFRAVKRESIYRKPMA
jgi:mycothiol synthase